MMSYDVMVLLSIVTKHHTDNIVMVLELGNGNQVKLALPTLTVDFITLGPLV